MLNWNTRNLSLNINFTNPVVISSGIMPDVLIVKINNITFFQNVDANFIVETNSTKIFRTLPKQFPKGISEE